VPLIAHPVRLAPVVWLSNVPSDDDRHGADCLPEVKNGIEFAQTEDVSGMSSRCLVLFSGQCDRFDPMEEAYMMRQVAIISALVIMVATSSLAQTPGGPGVVIAVRDGGQAVVRIGDQEQTVQLPAAKVGDMVVCTPKDNEGRWDCRLHEG
jgi:hypothetical protein